VVVHIMQVVEVQVVLDHLFQEEQNYKLIVELHLM
tara:strand:+ start:574 stop:678 length:105 start_codon:yes stop_codon:yes gene_type:complete